MLAMLVLLLIAQTPRAALPEVTEAEAERVVEPAMLWDFETHS